MTVTVSMPYWRSPETIRRSVDSVLAQTHRDLRLVVVNDGDRTTPPWPHLADIDDPRLIRFDLADNRGRYWSDAVTLAACDTEWWTPHDADDVSLPERFAAHLATGADVSFCHAHYTFLDGVERLSPVKATLVPTKDRLRTIARYPAGMYRANVARMVGGPHPECRGSYDTAMVCLLWHKFAPVVVDGYLYHVHKREGSLTTSNKTGLHTAWRRNQRRRVKALYWKVFDQPVDRWSKLLAPSKHVARQVADDTTRLRELIGRSIP